MNSLSLGDLANSFMLQNRGSSLKTEMARLTQELASGQVSDVKSVLEGNYSYLTDIQTGLTGLEGYKTTTTEAKIFAQSIQSVLGNLQDNVGDLGSDLILAASDVSIDTVSEQSSREAFEVLKSTISSLNINVAGRSLFSGAATDRAALGTADELMTELRAVVTGVIGPDAKLSAVQDWFDDPLGFEATLYKGSDTELSPFQLSKTEEVSLGVRAVDPELKDAMRTLAIAALSGDDALTMDATERKALLQAAGDGMLQNQTDLTALRARVGYAEARIETVTIGNASEKLSLEYAKGALLGADPYDTATRLEEVQFQLQSLYAVTVKASQLSLVNFL